MPPSASRLLSTAPVVGSGFATVAWLTLGPTMSSTGRLALLAMALGAHAVALLAVRTEAPSPVVLVVAALVLVVAVALPPQGSKDLWAYAMQGRIVAVHHSNPYVHRPKEFSHDPALARVAHGWRASRSPYGPAFVAVEATGAYLAGGSALRTRLFYQGLAAAAVLAVALALRRLAAGHAATVFLALNPAVAATVNGGHNDVLVGAGIVAAVVLADRRRPCAAGVVLALVALIKVTALVAVLAMVAWLLRRFGCRCAVAFTSVAAGVFIAGYGLVGGVAALDPVRSASGRGSRAALLGWPRRLFVESLVERGHSGRDAVAHSGVLVMVISVGCVVAVVISLVLPHTLRRSSQTVVVASLTALVLLSAYVLPWYALWVLPVAALAPRSRASFAAWTVGAALLVAYIEPPGNPPGSELAGVLSHLALPFALVAIAGMLLASRVLRPVALQDGLRSADLQQDSAMIVEYPP